MLGESAIAINDILRCPLPMAGLAVLAAASLAAQAHVDIVVPGSQQSRPISLFAITIAGSGERKTSADEIALKPIRNWEEKAYQQYLQEMQVYKLKLNAWNNICKNTQNSQKTMAAVEEAVKNLEEEPQPPLLPILTLPNTTYEGLCKQLIHGHPSLGIFSNDGGEFLGGYSMRREQKLQTIAGLSTGWDGQPIKLGRAGDGLSVAYGKRLSAHLMVQPDIGLALLSERELESQGFLSRFLLCYPESTIGYRFQHTIKPESHQALAVYDKVLTQLLDKDLPLAADTQNVLKPRLLPLEGDAVPIWNKFADTVEEAQQKNGKYAEIHRFASKLPEHVLRIAGVLALIENMETLHISTIILKRAMLLADYFASEALRLLGAGQVPVKLQKAQQLYEWLVTNTSDGFTVRMIQQYGPNSLRDQNEIKQRLHTLEINELIYRLPEGTKVDGRSAKVAWKLNQN